MYVQGYLLAVPEGSKDEYRKIEELFWTVAKDYGAKEQVICWEADVPDGKVTDFRRSVKVEEGEKVVFGWMVFPNKETADSCHEKIMTDERMEQFPPEMPFDGKRMVYGGFAPLVVNGRD